VANAERPPKRRRKKVSIRFIFRMPSLSFGAREREKVRSELSFLLGGERAEKKKPFFPPPLCSFSIFRFFCFWSGLVSHIASSHHIAIMIFASPLLSRLSSSLSMRSLVMFLLILRILRMRRQQQERPLKKYGVKKKRLGDPRKHFLGDLDLSRNEL